MGVLCVTGGSSSIGAAIALKAAREANYDVCIHYQKNHHKAESVAEKIKALGRKCFIAQADISNKTEVEALFSTIDAQLGPVTALVNNAGFSGVRKEFQEYLPDEIQEIISINFIGAFYCIQEAIERMQSGAAIVNVSSQAAISGGNRLSVYAASKAALSTLTLSLSRELAPKGIRINVVSPGVIFTDKQENTPLEELEQLQKTVPLGRLGTPEDIADAVLWLLSPQSAYITGTNVSVAGGR